MDKSSLIDLNSPNNNQENYYKLASPLIPIPNLQPGLVKCLPRLSDVNSNPFDKVLRNITNRDDPFESVFESAFSTKMELHKCDEKENVAQLISPIQTPLKSNKNKKFSTTPLYIEMDTSNSQINQSISLLPKSCTNSQNVSRHDDIYSANNSSLQCLADSILNQSLLMDESYQEALNIPLPNSPDSVNIELNKSQPSKNILKSFNEHPNESCVTSAEDGNTSKNGNNSENSNLNNAFINSTSKGCARLSTNLSITPITDSITNNLTSFHVESLGTSEISNIYPSVSSANSKGSGNILNKAFTKENANSLKIESKPICMERKCMSARKPTKFELGLRYLASMSDTPKKNLSHSFAGFQNKVATSNIHIQEATDDDSVFLEASYLGNMFSKFANETPDDLDDQELSVSSPPWLEEDINFKADENGSIIEEEQQLVTEKEVLKKDRTTSKDNNETLDSCASEESEAERKTVTDVGIMEDNDVRNARNILHNLSEILKSDGQIVDQRRLGENLLNSIALALNVENLNVSNNNKNEKVTETSPTISKEESKSKFKKTGTIPKQQENKNFVPKIKSNTVNLPPGQGKLDRHLKSKPEKDKVPTKGPLKAVIPLNNMAKIKKNLTTRMSTIVTPPKSFSFSFQNKRTSTPNDLKIKAPIAQSTPDTYKRNKNETDKDTSLGTRQFIYSFSKLARPASTGDVSYDSSENKPISPKRTSGSAPNISEVTSNSSVSKQNSNTAIPKMYMSRRKSASDLKANSNFLKAPETQLKRSSSFQSKITTANQNSASNVDINKSSNKNNATATKIKSNLISKPRSSLPKVLSK